MIAAHLYSLGLSISTQVKFASGAVSAIKLSVSFKAFCFCWPGCCGSKFAERGPVVVFFFSPDAKVSILET